MAHSFIKMHGLGNDFVIFDAREQSIAFTREQIQAIADRRLGVGCDQVIVMEKSPSLVAGSGPEDAPDPAIRRGVPDIFMRIYNADGGEVSSCGNATRCVAWLIMEETSRDEAVVETQAGRLHCRRMEGMNIRADMGEPKFDWRDIPLSRECDTLHLPITLPSPLEGEGRVGGEAHSDISARTTPHPNPPPQGGEGI